VDFDFGAEIVATNDFARKKTTYHDSTKKIVTNIFTSSKGITTDSIRNNELGAKLLPNLNLGLSPSKTFEVALARQKPSSNQCVDGNVDCATVAPSIAQQSNAYKQKKKNPMQPTIPKTLDQVC
jgi:hypothetical protein